ncbi:MAG: type II CRISPR RNA-guided endonuclease Cas9 [Alphaproteobacteria bacterium]|nr:type II CRISPR RNA-guided endonuclease Cas9 [Alphaproteobacteria bacterium]
MKYRLGLDLGVGSIGSAIIELDENGNALDIKDAGVRIFEVSEGAENRRVKRTARKNLIRTRKRLQLLAKKLFENELWVNDTPEGTEKLRSKSPYKIRYDALNEKLSSPYYMGRAILHLAKHRGAGFVSAAEELKDEEVTEDENKKNKKLSSYEQMAMHLKETNSRTIGEYFYKRLQDSYEKGIDGEKIAPEKHIIRQKTYAIEKKFVDYAIPRYLVKDEFNKIWDEQAKYFSQMNKEGLKQEIYDILFYEKSVAPFATGKCIYFRDENRLLKAHPLSEMRRIYEEVNNIRLETLTERKRLTLEQRDLIINELLLKGENAGKQKIKKLLNLTGQVKISLWDDRVIKAYLYSKEEFQNIEYIKNLSNDELVKFIDFLAEPKEDINNPNSRLLNEDNLIKKLKVILNIDDEKVIGDILIKLPKDRSMIGKSASEILIKEMKKEVLSQREITDRLAKDDKRFIASEEYARQMQGSYDRLPYYGEILVTDTQPLPPLVIENNKSLNKDEVMWGKIANPAVHMILNQLRLVVNDIIRIYGRPYEICLEVGRDVGMSTKKKAQFEAEQKKNEKLNEEAKKYLLERNMYVTGKNILKYKLAKEQGFVDAYNPTRKIPQNFVGFEIEHLCPQADSGSDTYNNLCLTDRNENLPKSNMFPYEWLSIRYKDNPEVIREVLENARKRMPQKAWRFEPDAREIYFENGDEDETSRYLADTRYVSKMAMRYLKAIVDYKQGIDDKTIENRIFSVRGKQTSFLRQRWGLLGLEYDLMGLDVPRYFKLLEEKVNPETGEITDREKNPEWKKKPRIDHRHHAMDAITVACVEWWMIKNMSNEEKLEKAYIKHKPLENVSNFRERVLEILKGIKVSHKPNHTCAGQFHEESGRTVLCINPEDENSIITVRARKILQVVKSFKDLDKLLVKNTIKDEWHERIKEDRIKQAKLKEHFELYVNTAEQILIRENEEAVKDGKKERKITEGMILSKAFLIIQEKGLWKGNNFRDYDNSSSLVNIPKHGVAYLSGNNHCVDFYELDGKVGWEVIKRFDANQKDFIPQWKKNGGKAIWSVQQGDMLELDTPDEWKGYTDKERCIARVKKFSDNCITIDYFTDARMTSPKEKELKYMFVDSLVNRGLSYLTKHRTRKIELTPFGKIKKKHKVLWDGKKN